MITQHLSHRCHQSAVPCVHCVRCFPLALQQAPFQVKGANTSCPFDRALIGKGGEGQNLVRPCLIPHMGGSNVGLLGGAG